MKKLTRNQRGSESYRKGHLAELAAMLFLMLKGYWPLGLRIHTPFGEIDLAMRRGDVLAVVEVKVRSSALAAGQAISPSQRERLTRAAQFLAARIIPPVQHVRLDAVLLAPPFYFPRHIKNAFGQDF